MNTLPNPAATSRALVLVWLLLLVPALPGADLKQSLGSIFEQVLTNAASKAVPARAEAPADLRAVVLATPYTWSDNGNELGTLTFAPDGSARATWSGEIHYWRVEAPDQLVISAMGTSYVTRLTYFSSDGSFSGARDRTSQVQDGAKTVLRPKNPVRPPGTSTGTNGLLAEYFDNRDLRAPPKVTRVDPLIDFDWSYGSPDPAIPNDNFGARWTGEIQPRFSESYVFSGIRDNGLRLWIDGQMIVELWDNGWGLYESKPVALQAGRRHKIRIDYYEDMGGTGLSLKWRSASQAEELVPTALLFPAAQIQTDGGTKPPTADSGNKPGSSGKLDRSQWFATRGSWNDRFGEGAAYDDSAIEVAGDTITLKADRTDQVAALYSRPFALKSGDSLVIKRSVFVHAANRKFEGCLTAYAVADSGVNPKKPPYEASLFNLGYRNFDYETDQNLFCLSDGKTMPPGPGKFAGGTAPTIPPLWDQWFDEELRYDSGTGYTVCLINGQERLRFRAAPLTQPYIKLLFHPYGWHTGHYLRMRNLTITIQSGPTGPGLASDLRARLLGSDYVWSDNGVVMGNIRLAADGSARASWSSETHYWRLEAPDQLVIAAMGTTYVTRLTYQPGDGSFSGARDRTSQMQDGAKTVLRPVSPQPPPGSSTNGTGLRAEYFDNRELRGPPKHVQVDYSVTTNWGEDAPCPGVPADNFSVRWTGEIQPRYSENYVFKGSRDDGVRIWIDDRLIVDAWGSADSAPYASSPIPLTAGRRHRIRVEYFEESGKARIEFRWQSPSQSEERVPGSCLYPPLVGRTDDPIPPPTSGNDPRPPGAATDVMSTFDQDAQGWSVISLPDEGPYDRPLGNSSPSHLASGGNPGGCLTATDPGPGNFYWEAPAPFLGDQRARYGGALRFDLTSEGGELFDEADVVIIGAGLVLVHDTPKNPGKSWTRYSVPLVEYEWRKTSLKGERPTREEFQRVLGSIKSLRLRGEFRNGPEICALDNVRLTTPGSP